MHDCSHGEKLISLQDALAHYAHLTPLPTQRKSLMDAVGNVLAAPVSATCDLPLFTQSAMDGFAFRCADQATGLTLVGEVPAGEMFGRALAAGEAVRIFTGAALPMGADCVARQEIVRLDHQHLHLREPVAAGQDVRQQGEEVQQGQSLLVAGAKLTPGRLAALAMAGVTEVAVRRRARVTLIITGNEVVRQGDTLTVGKVHDANGPLMQSWLMQQQVDMLPPVWVGDTLDELRDALTHAASHADLIITSGGASVGRYDYLAEAARQSGFQCDFHGVAQRPGKPLWCGRKGECVLLALPGNPAAVLVGLYVHAAAILQQLQGRAVMDGWQVGRLASSLCAHPKVALLQRMQLQQTDDACLWLSPLPHQASHQLSNLADAGALVWLPAGAGELAPGETLPFVTLR